MNRGELARWQRQYTVTPGPMDTPCWVWHGPMTPNGYGSWRVGPGAGTKVAHRIGYEHFVGPVPDGLELDHLCSNRACVNVVHLEPVTHSENVLRQDHFERNKTQCPRGHPYDTANTQFDKQGRRKCRVCDRDRKRASRVRSR